MFLIDSKIKLEGIVCMDNVTTGIGGIFLGWLLAQGGFFFQRRVSLCGEMAKAAYFLLVLLDELDAIITIKEGKVVAKEFTQDISVSFYNKFIGKENFHKEVSDICEKVSMVNIKMARNIRRSCMLIDLASKNPVKEIEKLDPCTASQIATMYIKGLRAERYNIEQLIFHILKTSDLKYFFSFCKKIGWGRTKDHFLKKKSAELSLDDLTTTLDASCKLLSEKLSGSCNL